MKDQAINKLMGLLSESFESFQLEMIRAAALIALEDFEVNRKSVNIVPYSSIDIDIYKMFLVAKKVEGCTERTLQYYGDELKKFREGIGKPVPENGKGQKERYVYLNAKAQLAIREYLKERNDDNPYLFVGKAKPHDRLKQSWYESNLRKLGRLIGIENVHPHRFRRTAATLALNRGMPIEQVQQMLGHTEIQTTLIYAQSAQENVKISHKKYVT